MLIVVDSEAKYHKTTKYGPEVQGSKNKEITNQIAKAHRGETTFLSILFIFGLQASGTSNLKNFPYQK